MKNRPLVARRERIGTVARIIHGAIAGGLALAFAVFLYLRSQLVLTFAPEVVRGLKLAGYIVLGAVILLAQLTRGRLKAPLRGDDLCDWWSENLPRAVVIWAVAEAGGLVAIVLGWVIGDPTLLAVGGAVGLALLFVTRPRRLERTL